MTSQEGRLVIGGSVYQRRRLCALVTRSLVLVLSAIVPATRSYKVILKDIDENMKKLMDDWLCVQMNKRQAKKED